MLYISVLAQNTGGIGNPIFLIAMIGVMFVFMILPNMRKQKKAKQFQSTLEKGKKIVTLGGVHGKIVSADEKTLTLELEDGKMKIERTGVSFELTNSHYPDVVATENSK